MKEIGFWICIAAALITIGKFMMQIIQRCVKHITVLKNICKTTLNSIYKYAPLFMAILLPISGIVLFILAPVAFEKQHLLHNSYVEAYKAYSIFVLLTLVSFLLSKYMYADYDAHKNKPLFSN